MYFVKLNMLLIPSCQQSIAVQQPNLSHPFHLHGYAFNVIGIGRSPDRNVKKINLKHALDLDKKGLLHRQFDLPPAKDTVAVPNNGYVIFRFRADNPGKLTTTIETFRVAMSDEMQTASRSRNCKSCGTFAYTDYCTQLRKISPLTLHINCMSLGVNFFMSKYLVGCNRN